MSKKAETLILHQIMKLRSFYEETGLKTCCLIVILPDCCFKIWHRFRGKELIMFEPFLVSSWLIYIQGGTRIWVWEALGDLQNIVMHRMVLIVVVTQNRCQGYFYTQICFIVNFQTFLNNKFWVQLCQRHEPVVPQIYIY